VERSLKIAKIFETLKNVLLNFEIVKRIVKLSWAGGHE
jgi:hypothetical protein